MSRSIVIVSVRVRDFSRKRVYVFDSEASGLAITLVFIASIYILFVLYCNYCDGFAMLFVFDFIFSLFVYIFSLFDLFSLLCCRCLLLLLLYYFVTFSYIWLYYLKLLCNPLLLLLFCVYISRSLLFILSACVRMVIVFITNGTKCNLSRTTRNEKSIFAKEKIDKIDLQSKRIREMANKMPCTLQWLLEIQ